MKFNFRGQKPQRIIFFRDGVSEGQFDEVRRAEIRAIRSACKKLQPDGYEPKVTFLVVQKRHHTRLFPLNPRDSQDRNNNVPAGILFYILCISNFLISLLAIRVIIIYEPISWFVGCT